MAPAPITRRVFWQSVHGTKGSGLRYGIGTATLRAMSDPRGLSRLNRPLIPPPARSASRRRPVLALRRAFRTLWQAVERFLVHDGWAIASHIALSVLMSLFPFLIVVAAVAGLIGSADLADEVGRLMLEAWPAEVAAPLALEVRKVLTVARSDALTVGALLAIYFASSGIEAVRVGLNRAYEVVDWRPWWLTRLEAIAFVMAGAIVVLAFAFLIVLGPLIWRTILSAVPQLAPLGWIVAFARLTTATILILGGLVLSHKLLAAGRRSLWHLWPGIAFTLLSWLVCGYAFGLYLDSFAANYVSTYAGLASAMIALVFLYALAAVFLIGGEINAVVAGRARR
jgi:membrane protein